MKCPKCCEKSNYLRLFCPKIHLVFIRILNIQNIQNTKKPSLNRNEKVTSENCGIQITKPNLARHKKSCSAGTLYCVQCPNFSTLSQDNLNYHIAKQHSAAGPSKTFKCKLCYAEFPGFMLYVNTKTLNMEHKLGFERAILMWRT